MYTSSIISIYTLSLHDALPISYAESVQLFQDLVEARFIEGHYHPGGDDRQSHRAGADLEGLFQPAGKKSGQFTTKDRKSTRLNSSHTVISYAVFCLKKKKT